MPKQALLVITMALIAWMSIGAGQAAHAAGIRYVAVGGSDSGDCTNIATPCASIQYAHNQATAGDTIRIAPGTYVGSVDIDRTITLEGDDAATTVLDGDQAAIVVNVAGTDTGFTLRRLTVRNGQRGLLAGGVTVIEDTVIRDNHPPAGEHGGGVWVYGPTTIRNTSIVSNTGLYGGGLDAGDALTLTHSLIAYNRAEVRGGGIHLRGENFSATIENSTISNNHSDFADGGINIASPSPGLQVTLRNATVAFNSAAGDNAPGGIGGAIGATVTLVNTIIANNPGDRQCDSNLGTWQSLGHNLSSDESCQLTASGDQQTVNPLLGVLGDNGGPSWTHAIGPDSPAVDAGDNAQCPSTDQRGRSRPFDGDGDSNAVCDIGAYEFGAADTPPPPQTTRYVATTGNDSGNDCLSAASPCATIGHAVAQAFLRDTVQIASGIYTENLTIAKHITLQGADAADTIVDGGGIDRIITMGFLPPYDLVIRNLTLRNGTGGILTGAGPLWVENSRFYGNDATGQGIDEGGGLHLLGPATIHNSSIYSNSGEYGGGIYARAALTLTASAVYSNTATESGGGLQVSIVDGDNRAVLTNSTLSGNHAPAAGGIDIGSPGTALTLRHVTLAHNRVPDGSNNVGGLRLTLGASAQLANTLIAANTGAEQCAGVVNLTSLGGNLAGDQSCGLTAASDQPDADPRLGPLQDNGGPTWTHALLRGSPAVDAAVTAHCLPTDQRGETRPVGPACDSGAYEADGTESPGDGVSLHLPALMR